MRKLRTETEIMVDILSHVSSQQCTVSEIVKEINVPYSRASEYVNLLISKKLVSIYEEKEKKFINITREGSEFLSEYRKLRHLLNIYGLKP